MIERRSEMRVVNRDRLPLVVLIREVKVSVELDLEAGRRESTHVGDDRVRVGSCLVDDSSTPDSLDHCYRQG